MTAIKTPTAAPIDANTLGLSDTELDTVSGGVHPIVVLYSIISLGVACAVVSVAEATQGGNCGERLDGPIGRR